MDYDKVLGGIIIIGLTFLVVSTLTLINSKYSNSLDAITISSTQNFTIANGSSETLSETPNSLTASSLNQTWLSFDSSNENVALSPSPISTTLDSNYSYSIWLNITQLSGSKAIWTYSHNRITLDGNILKVFARNQTGANYNISYTYPNDAEWHNVLFDHFNNGTAINYSLYFDGALVNNSVVYNPYSAGSTALSRVIGSILGSLQGSADNLRIYFNSPSITQEQVTEIYESGRYLNTSLRTDGLTVLLPLNENQGTTVYGLNSSLGSIEYLSAVQGATWQNDGINITLVEDTDYTLSGNTFTLINSQWAWSFINTSYSYNNESQSQSILNYSNENFYSNVGILGILLTLFLLSIVIAILFKFKISSRI